MGALHSPAVKEYAVNADGLRIYDTANLPPIRVLEPRFKKGFAPTKASRPPPPTPAKICPSSMGALLEGVQYRPLVLDRKSAPRRERAYSSRLITSAYRHLLAPFFARNNPSRRAFIEHTVPYLIANTSAQTAAVLAAVWFSKYKPGHKGAFTGEVSRAIYAAGKPSGGHYRRLRTQRQRDALRICETLSRLKPDGVFPLPGREIQLRLLLSQPKAGWDLIQQLVRLKVLEVVTPGLSRPEAAKRGEKARAALYRLVGTRS